MVYKIKYPDTSRRLTEDNGTRRCRLPRSSPDICDSDIVHRQLDARVKEIPDIFHLEKVLQIQPNDLQSLVSSQLHHRLLALTYLTDAELPLDRG